MEDRDVSNKALRVAYLAWGSVALFFFYQYILRVLPNVMVVELRQEFKLTAEEFSTLGYYYLYAYACLQIPLGIIVDRVGVRKTVVTSLILCLGGSVMIGMAETLWMAKVSRLLVGAGSASAFMCGLKLVADRLPAGKRGLLIGATLAFGTIGPLVGTKPVVMLLESVGWRNAIYTLVGCGLPVLVLMLMFIPRHRKEDVHHGGETFSDIFRHLWEVLRNPKVMLYAFIAIGLYTPFSALADLWGTAFLMRKYGFERGVSAQTVSMMYMGLAMGSLVLPWICEKYNVLNRSIRACCFIILLIFVGLLYGPQMNAWIIAALLLLLGFFCGSEMMCFTGAALYTTPSNSGLTLGVVNTMNMMGGAVLQQVIGKLLDMQWKGALDSSGVRVYSAPEYVFALSVLIVVVVLCLIATFALIRRTKGETVHSEVVDPGI